MKFTASTQFTMMHMCRFWDTKSSKWDTTGVTSVKSKDSVSCKTTHFTDFAGYEVLTTDQGPTEQKKTGGDSDDKFPILYLILGAVGIIFVVTVLCVLCFSCRKSDK